MASFPIINGVEYSFASITVEIDGDEFNSIQSVNYKQSKVKGRIHGNGQELIGRTRGQREYTFDMELLRKEWDEMQTKLLANAAQGQGFGDIPFDVLVQYADDGQAVDIDDLILCFVEEVDTANSQGVDATVVKLTLSAGKIKHNGAEI